MWRARATAPLACIPWITSLVMTVLLPSNRVPLQAARIGPVRPHPENRHGPPIQLHHAKRHDPNTGTARIWRYALEEVSRALRPPIGERSRIIRQP